MEESLFLFVFFHTEYFNVFFMNCVFKQIFILKINKMEGEKMLELRFYSVPNFSLFVYFFS